MNKRAEAFARYNDAAVLQMLVEILPKVAHEVAAPMASIDRLTVISTDGAGQLSRQVTDNIVQTMALLKDTTGVDLESLLSGYLSGGRGVRRSNGSAPAEVEGTTPATTESSQPTLRRVRCVRRATGRRGRGTRPARLVARSDRRRGPPAPRVSCRFAWRAAGSAHPGGRSGHP